MTRQSGQIKAAKRYVRNMFSFSLCFEETLEKTKCNIKLFIAEPARLNPSGRRTYVGVRPGDRAFLQFVVPKL